MASTTYSGGRDDDTISRQRPENALDALLDELQTFARPPPPGNPNTSTTSTSTLGEIGRKGSVDSGTAVTASGMTAGSTSSLRRLHSYPSSSDCGSSSSSPPAPQLSRLQVSGDLGNQKPPQISPKPPVPERNAELLSQLSSGRRVPPPPPPRTSSRSPLASPTSPSLPPRGQTGSSTLLRRGAPGRSSLREPLRGSGGLLSVAPSDAEELQIQGTFNPASNSSSCESVNSQEGIQQQNPQQQRGRKELLEQRHQELLRKQRALQEQYARLQQLQRGTATAGLVIPAGNSNTLIPANTTPDLLMLKKTGSESNLLAKMGLGAGLVATMSGSLTSLAPPVPQPRTSVALQQVSQGTQITTGDEVNTTGTSTTTTATTTTSKIYETDIL